MAVTVSVYNHTASLIARGKVQPDIDQKLMLCTAATFNAADTAITGVTKTEVSSGNGYTTGGALLTTKAGSVVTTNDGKFTADDVTWSATGSGITASYGILYLSGFGGEPILFFDFGGSQTASSGSVFKVAWNANGIFTLTVA